MTIKFLKEWGLTPLTEGWRKDIQRRLDGGGEILRTGQTVHVSTWGFELASPIRAVKFAAALNKLRRPLRLIKQDLDADWAVRVKERDNQTCILCGAVGDKIGGTIAAHTEIDEETGETREVKERVKKDVLGAHHWLKTKARAGMARWARPCGVTVHFAEHIHTLHENPCWLDLEPICRHVAIMEGEAAVKATVDLTKVVPTEARVRALWLDRCGHQPVPLTCWPNPNRALPKAGCPNPPREFS